MTREHFHALKRSGDDLMLDAPSSATAASPAYPSAVPITEGAVLRVRRASTTGDEAMACVVKGSDGQGWAVLTDGGERLDVDEVTAMVVAVDVEALP